jgi:hypothetical protein
MPSRRVLFLLSTLTASALLLTSACSSSDTPGDAADAGGSDATSTSHPPSDGSATGADADATDDASLVGPPAASSVEDARADAACEGKAGCAVWSDVYISWYGFNDNSCTTENVHGCNDIAYGAPLSTKGEYGAPYPNAGNITHTTATEGTGTYEDPITAAASADADPAKPTTANPRHKFAAAGGVTLTPGTIIYNPEVQKYFIMEDSCIECGDEFACIVSPEDTDDGKVPAGCVPGTNLHIDFWMGPQIASDTKDLDTCQDNSSIGDDWKGGPGQVIVNPPADLPVVTAPLYSGTGASGECWTAKQAAAVSCGAR